MTLIRPDNSQLLQPQWDLLVIGGGITGAGILLEAARLGLRAVLVEQRDFAWGTSSRSSKMVHGGLRYLAQGDFRLTRHSLLEREWLIRELPELVVRQHYLFPVRRGQFPGRWALKAGLWLYDLLAGIRDHHWLARDQVRTLAPQLRDEDLVGGMTYTDALTDDSRLVMRVLHEAASLGATAVNYMAVKDVLRTDVGYRVEAVDACTGEALALRAREVINATGAWADRLSGAEARVRPQRGSHLFVSANRLPVAQCFTLVNPADQRPVFIFPWQGCTCIGTTDLDHRDSLDQEPYCTDVEIDYLLDHVNRQFPDVGLTRQDIISTMAGVRPIIASGKGVNPSAERRDHAVWQAGGLVTVSGGKLTTFRLIALDALHAVGFLDDRGLRRAKRQAPAFEAVVGSPGTLGQPLAPLPEGDLLEQTLRWICRNEQVAHLDDLLLRRIRLGNLVPDGAQAIIELACQVCGEELGWPTARQAEEVARYLDIVSRFYGVTLSDAEKAAAPQRRLA